jgi:hypothetical protein
MRPHQGTGAAAARQEVKRLTHSIDLISKFLPWLPPAKAQRAGDRAKGGRVAFFA